MTLRVFVSEFLMWKGLTVQLTTKWPAHTFRYLFNEQKRAELSIDCLAFTQKIQIMGVQAQQQQQTVEANRLKYSLSQPAAQGQSGHRVRWNFRKKYLMWSSFGFRKAEVAYILLIIFMLIAWSSILIGETVRDRKIGQKNWSKNFKD